MTRKEWDKLVPGDILIWIGTEANRDKVVVCGRKSCTLELKVVQIIEHSPWKLGNHLISSEWEYWEKETKKDTNMNDKTFWLIWNPASSIPPSFCHSDRAAANTEAARLARLNPGQSFFVLRAERCTVVNNTIVTELVEEPPF